MSIRDYIESGFRCFPLYNVKDGKCECGDPECKAIAKHPKSSNWQHTPLWSEEQLDSMEEYGQLDTGFGVCLDDHLVVDVDARNGGFDSYKKLTKKLGYDLRDKSGFVVETGGGGLHIYFACERMALVAKLNEYPGIDWKSGMGKGSFVVGYGSRHANGQMYEREKGFPDTLTDAPQELIDMLRRKDHHRAIINNENVDVTDDEIAEYLSYISPDCSYEEWIRCGMAIHHTTNGAGFDIWDDWSNQSDKYPGRANLDRHWHSFGKSSTVVTLGTLIHYAEEYGYQPPVTFEAPIEQPVGDHPFPIDTVDILRPPGFVGEVAQWINEQCRFPREYLASISALVTIGNISGLRYTDDIDGVTANLFAFSVSASATGKEAVQQAMAELHRAAGVHPALAGSIKSEQEIIRNLIRHQAAFYVIDEVGYLLKKITNSSRSGGASYLEGVIAVLMSAYSKANGFMLLTGDMKEQVQKELANEMAQCRKKISENEDASGFCERRIPQLERALENIDNGLERPFLSMIGYTTPETFNDLITFEQATNGFIGRSLLTMEKETNPKRKKGFRKTPLKDSMGAALQNLYSPGVYSVTGSRIEHYSSRVKIKTDKRAAEMMEAVADWIEDYAEQHKSQTGLEAIVRRGYEMCAKISLILAVPEGIRTTEHVRWAYALMRRDIDEKINLAHGNIMGAKKDGGSQGEALRAKILSLISHDHGETFGVIKHRCRKWNERDVQVMLDNMIEEGIVAAKPGRKYRGKTLDVYFMV